MKNLKIKGHKVIFGKVRKHCWIGGSYASGPTHRSELRQDWFLDSLDLHGWVRVDDRTIKEIQERIQREVDFDLEQREKRRLGLPTTTYSDCCR